jgi:hypothetical protein
MKNTNVQQHKQQNQDRHSRPENKDNLDSRSGEEQDFKGNDVTHNERETKERKRKSSINKPPF